MGFFGRIYNLWKGFLSLFVGSMEEAHPEIAYENAINSMTEKYSKLKTAAAGLIKRRTQLEESLEKMNREINDFNLQAEAAVEQGDDDLAVHILDRVGELESARDADQIEYEQIAAEADGIKAQLNEFKNEIEKLKREKDRTVAQIKSAEATKQINDQLEGLSMDDEIKALSGVREKAANLRAETKISNELKAESLDGKLAALKAKTGSAQAQNRLAALKAAKAAKAGGTTTTTNNGTVSVVTTVKTL